MLKQQPVSMRGLARVIGIQPSTLRRRIEQLVDKGWLTREGQEVRYSQKAYSYAAPASRRAAIRAASVLKQLGWVDFRPPEG
jgi:DNA-binding Lrp family transcriptional regulator